MANKRKKRRPKLEHGLKRKARLKSARVWVRKNRYDDEKLLVRAYRRQYKVDFRCASEEMKLLGIELDRQWVETVLASEEAQAMARKRKKMAKREQRMMESDHFFAYIVGHTPGGAPFGITWEELEADPKLKADLIPDKD